jgi:hypothetical protein
MATNSNAMDVDASHAPPAYSQSTLAHPTPTDLPETDHIVLDVDGHKYRTRVCHGLGFLLNTGSTIWFNYRYHTLSFHTHI